MRAPDSRRARSGMVRDESHPSRTTRDGEWWRFGAPAGCHRSGWDATKGIVRSRAGVSLAGDLSASRRDPPGRARSRCLPGVRGDRRDVGQQAPVPRLRRDRLLRQQCEHPRHEALPGERPPRDALGHAGAGLDVVLRLPAILPAGRWSARADRRRRTKARRQRHAMSDPPERRLASTNHRLEGRRAADRGAEGHDSMRARQARRRGRTGVPATYGVPRTGDPRP